MYNLKKAKRFSMIFSSMEYDNLIKTLQFVIFVGEIEEDRDECSEAWLALYKKTLKVCIECAYFDIKNEEVHLQLGFHEFEAVLSSLLACTSTPSDSGDNTNSPFPYQYSYDSILASGNYKTWENNIAQET